MSLDCQIKQYQKDFKEDRLPKPACCQACGAIGPLHWHDVYYRSVVTFQSTVILPIHRILCAVCRHTFALLPDFIVKFHRYAKEVIRGYRYQGVAHVASR